MVKFLVGARYLSILKSIQTGYGAHKTSYSMGTGVSVPEHKVARA